MTTAIDSDDVIEKMNIAKRLEIFGGYTTMHGFKRIISAKPTPKRIAWIIVLATAWTMFTIQVSLVLKHYFEYPKQVSTELELGGVPFPDITLCNLGSFDFYSTYRLSKGIPKIIEYYDAQLTKDNDTIRNRTVQKDDKESNEEEENGDYDDYDYYGENDSERDEELRRSIEYANETFARVMAKFYNLVYNNYRSSSMKDDDWGEIIDRLFSRTTISANVPPEMLAANGVQENEFIVKCTFKKKPCKLKRFFDPYFFNCFTFTPPNVTVDLKHKSSLSEGIENGFSVMLLAGSRMLKDMKAMGGYNIPGLSARDSLLSGAGGIRVVIHPSGTKPFPLTEGYDVPPGMMASLGVNPKLRKRLGKPWGDCTKPFINSKQRNGPYRRIACVKVCIQKRVKEECKCLENTLPTEDDLLTNIDENKTANNESICASDFKYVKPATCTNSTQKGKDIKQCPKQVEKCSATRDFRKCFKALSDKAANCSDDVLRKLYAKMLCAEREQERLSANETLLDECGCHPSCEEVQYDTSYSLSQWPSHGLDGDTVDMEIFQRLNFIGKFACADKRAMYTKYKDNDVNRALKDFSKINVYISDANVLVTSESPAVTFTQLVSDIGGQLGIWIGVSIITLVEVLEMLILLIMDCCHKRSQKQKVGTEVIELP